MNTNSNISVENLAKLIEDLSVSEKAKLFSLLSGDWFEKKDTPLNKFQKKALDDANDKEQKGKSVFHSWEDTKNFVRNRSEK